MDITDEQIKGLIKAILHKYKINDYLEVDLVSCDDPEKSKRFMEEIVYTVRHYLYKGIKL
tara:strand:+ start:2943 stop:3122 length:180 start_codon:yes stop_codon:yes gene_type:complete